MVNSSTKPNEYTGMTKALQKGNEQCLVVEVIVQHLLNQAIGRYQCSVNVYFPLINITLISVVKLPNTIALNTSYTYLTSGLIKYY